MLRLRVIGVDLQRLAYPRLRFLKPFLGRKNQRQVAVGRRVARIIAKRSFEQLIQLSEDHIATEYLPPYAPELNPVEYIWAYWKQHELPNVCPKDYWELDERARKALRRMRRKPRLITAFWKQSSLCLD